MSKISVDVSSARIPVLQVGYQGENEVTDVLFDISSWITEFGEGVAQLRVKRPGNSEDESYVLSLTITDGIAVWTVSDTDTFNKGNGKVQLSYLVGNIVKKAVIYPYKVGKSIVGADNPVDPFDSWIERSKAWAIGETLDGDNVPETDETYQNNAKYYAEQADILGSAQVVLATEQATLATAKATLATEKADAAAESEANAAASEAAVNGVSTQLTTRMSAIETEQAVQDARMDTFTSLPEGSTSGNAELADIRVGADGTTYDTAGNAVRGQIGELKSDIGEWSILETNEYTGQYPYVQIDAFVSRKIWVNVAECTWEHDDITVRGSVDGWQTQETIEKFSQDTFIVTVPNTYSSIRIAINGKSSQTGNLKIVTHQLTNDAISDYVVQNVNDIDSINGAINEINYNFESLTNGIDLAPFKDQELVATRFEGFYLNTGDMISAIGNTAFVVKQYAVTQGVTYNISGRSCLNADLPIAAFGNIPVANGAVFQEVLLAGSTNYSDYDLNYTPKQDGYIFIAVHTNYTELSAYSTALNSEALKKVEDFMLQNIKIQLFGDSITDNQWGDLKTWANLIPNYFGSDTVIVNDAVGGSGIGHGKSTTTPSHQSEDYNFVHDLVTDGVTLQTDADAIVILVGTNNWTSGTPVGDMSSTGTNTIYGALKGIIQYISQHSAAKIFICTIPQRYNSADQSKDTNAYGEPVNSNGVSLADYCEPFRKLSAFYGMPCIDLNYELGWNRLNISNFCGDGLHPNVKGDQMIASIICSEIKKHF